jgi:hypothetical protein
MKHVNINSNQPAHSEEAGISLEEEMLQKTKEIEASTPPAQDIDIDDSTLAANVIEALREIYDPEIPERSSWYGTRPGPRRI